MDIDTNFTAQLYESARKLTDTAQPEPKFADQSFAETLAKAAEEITQTLQRGEATAEAAASGGGDVQAVVEALTATELALQTAVSVRDRVVEAYQDVLRMPV